MDWATIGKAWIALLGISVLAWLGSYIKRKWFDG